MHQPSHNPVSDLSRRWTGLGALLLLGIGAVRLGQTFVDWHRDDDLRNMRWVVEYRDAPWQALTQLHSVHDHIRPFTLMATWLGAQLSDGAWWGPHLLLVLLAALAFAGAATWAGQLAQQRWVGLAAGALILGLPGSAALPTWNAWLCSAGELAFGLWALVAFRHAQMHQRWPWAAALLLACAGLFKEPGWVVYPAAMAGMAISGPWHRRTGAGLVGLAALAAGGMVLTWHPTNLYRAGDAAIDWATRWGAFSEGILGALIQTPATQQLPGLGPAIWAAVLGLLIVGRAGARWRWGLGATALVWALGLIWPDAQAPLLGLALLAQASAWRSRATAPVLMVLAAILPMLAFSRPNAVQLLSAQMGLVVALGLALQGAAAAHKGREWRGLLAGAWLSLVALQFAHPSPWSPPAKGAEHQAAQVRLLGLGALAQATGSRDLQALGPLDDWILHPLVGLGMREADGRPAEILVAGSALLMGEPTRLEQARATQVALDLQAMDQARPAEDAPRVRPGRGRVAPPSGEARPEKLGTPLDIGPGWYALGLHFGPVFQPEARAQEVAAADQGLRLQDACGRSWTLRTTAAAVREAVVVFAVHPACQPVGLSRAPALDPQAQAFLLPLPDPSLSLRGAPPVTKRVDVQAAQDGVVPTVHRPTAEPPR